MIKFVFRCLPPALAVLAWAGLPSPAGAATTNVSYGSFFFNPKVVQIRVGDTINWVGSGTHNATGTGADPLCGALPCSRTFNAAGQFPYVCTVGAHAANGMTGLVVVLPSVVVTPAKFTNITRLANGQIRLAGTTTAGQTNILQATTNLAVPDNWVPIDTSVPASTNFLFVDTNAPSLQLRFYRVVEK